MKYATKPFIVDAMQWTGNISEIEEFLLEEDPNRNNFNFKFNNGNNALFIKPTRNVEPILVPIGFFVIKEQYGFDGFYPCNDEIFKQKYRPLGIPDVDETN